MQITKGKGEDFSNDEEGCNEEEVDNKGKEIISVEPQKKVTKVAPTTQRVTRKRTRASTA